jgi:hypothetical protein
MNDDLGAVEAGTGGSDLARSANRLARRHTLLRERFVALERQFAAAQAEAERLRAEAVAVRARARVLRGVLIDAATLLGADGPVVLDAEDPRLVDLRERLRDAVA